MTVEKRAKLRKKIGIVGEKCFWVNKLQQVLEKEGWQCFLLNGQASDDAEIFRVENITVLLYIMTNGNEVAITQQNEALLGYLEIAKQNNCSSVYLVSDVGENDTALAAAILQAWSKLTDIGTAVLYFPEIYGPGLSETSGICGQYLWAVQKSKNIAPLVETGSSRDFLYVDDAIYGVLQAIMRKYSGQPLRFASNDPQTLDSWKVALKTSIGSLPKVVDGTVSEQKWENTVTAGLLASNELGWQPRYTLAEGLTKTWQALQAQIQTDTKQQITEQRQAKMAKLKKQAIPYIENVVGALLMLVIMYYQGLTPVNNALDYDVNFIYISVMGLLYGKRQALHAMVFATAILIYSWLSHGSSYLSVMYVPENLLHITLYLFTAVTTGYFADSRQYERTAAKWQEEQSAERYRFLRKLYDETISIKDQLYRQIVNSDDSIGRIYRIIRSLDSVELENIFTQAAVVTSKVLDVKNIAIYVVGSDGFYLRQKVRLGNLTDKQPRSLRVADYGYLQELIKVQSIFVNRELRAGVPDLAAPIIYDGKVIAMLAVFDLHFSQWSNYQKNLLSITARLIASSLGRAYQYENEVQARRFVGATRILQAAEFTKIHQELQVRHNLQDNFTVATLAVENSELTPEELDSRLTGVIRNEDYIGKLADGYYIMLPDANDKVRDMVQKRLSNAGIYTKVSEVKA